MFETLFGDLYRRIYAKATFWPGFMLGVVLGAGVMLAIVWLVG